jgi:hypothetical protein
MIASFSEKRLLFKAEMMAALRTLQDDTSAAPVENVFGFDDSANMIKDAEGSLLRAVAQATSTDPADLTVEYTETMTVLKQPDGSYLPEE